MNMEKGKQDPLLKEEEEKKKEEEEEDDETEQTRKRKMIEKHTVYTKEDGEERNGWFCCGMGRERKKERNKQKRKARRKTQESSCNAASANYYYCYPVVFDVIPSQLHPQEVENRPDHRDGEVLSLNHSDEQHEVRSR